VKQALPAEFTRPSVAGTSALIVGVFALWLVPALALRSLLTSALPLAVKLALGLPLGLLAGLGLHHFGFVGHEGSHFTLHSSRRVSLFLGVFFSSLVPLHLEMGFAVIHLRHHRFTNTEDDPDVVILRPLNTLAKRLVLARQNLSGQHLLTCWDLALGREVPTGGFPMERASLAWFARLNLVLSVFFSGFYLALWGAHPPLAWAVIGVPWIVAIVFGGMRPLIEHAGTTADPARCARSSTHWAAKALSFGHSLHLIHHFYPNVPVWRLPRLERWLGSRGALPAGMPVEPSLVGTFRYVSPKYPYGRA
jgi:fatty acid desaturase